MLSPVIPVVRRFREHWVKVTTKKIEHMDSDF